MYDVPRHNFAPFQHNHGQEVAKPHPYHAIVTEEERQIEYSETVRPEKETRNSPEEETANTPEDKAVNLPGEETRNFSGAETQDPSEMEVHNPLGDLPEVPPEAIDGNPTEPKAKDDANDEIPTVEKTNVQTETDATVRRLIRQREPPRRFHYPELGNPLVSVVASMFQGLTTALINSLNIPSTSQASLYWLVNQ